MPTAISESILHAIGATPVVRLRRVVERDSAAVLVKLEYNPTGSCKDRMALAMIEGAEAAAPCARACASSNSPAAAQARRSRSSAR
jgi:threonine synthase